MSAYYNEHDPFAAAWLRELIKAGFIADGEVDERSIELVQPSDLRGFVQCHFFAGIGGWSYALRLAGWDDSREVWTGSCPCQPWSMAGDGQGTSDSRHLWPAWFRLIRECCPSVIFGEQVASLDGLYWLDLVYRDVEAENYALGAVDLSGASLGAADIRSRLWFVADTNRAEFRGEPYARSEQLHGEVSGVGALDDTECGGAGRSTSREGCQKRAPQGRREDQRRGQLQALDTGLAHVLGDSNGAGQQAGGTITDGADGWNAGRAIESASALRSFWRDAEWIDCTDGKARPVEPGTFPLATGIPARVGRLRGYGNAIKPQVAQAFIEAYLDSVG